MEVVEQSQQSTAQDSIPFVNVQLDEAGDFLPERLFIGVDIESGGEDGAPVVHIGFCAVNADRISFIPEPDKDGTRWRYKDISRCGNDALAVVWKCEVHLPFLRTGSITGRFPGFSARCLKEFWLKDAAQTTQLLELERWVAEHLPDITNECRHGAYLLMAVNEMYRALANFLDRPCAEDGRLSKVKFVSNYPEFDVGHLNSLLALARLPHLGYRPSLCEGNRKWIGQCAASTEFYRWLSRGSPWHAADWSQFPAMFGFSADIPGVVHDHNPANDAEQIVLQYRRASLAFEDHNHGAHQMLMALTELMDAHGDQGAFLLAKSMEHWDKMYLDAATGTSCVPTQPLAMFRLPTIDKYIRVAGKLLIPRVTGAVPAVAPPPAAAAAAAAAAASETSQ